MNLNGDSESIDKQQQSVRAKLQEIDKKLFAANLRFVKSIPEWANDPANHRQIVAVLANLPSEFMVRSDLRDLVWRAVQSLPLDVINDYFGVLSGATEEEKLAVVAELRELDQKYENNLDAFLAIELAKLGPDGYQGSLADGR